MSLRVRKPLPLLAAVLLGSGAQQAAAALNSFEPLPAAAVAPEERDPAKLDVALAVFDPGIPEQAALRDQQGVFSKIREIETHYLPYVLRETLVETGEWGAVRVVPRADSTAELLLSGRIVVSDGITLKLALRAVDSSGREWLNETYAVTATDPGDRRDAAYRVEPFQSLYDRVASDLRAARMRLDDRALSTIAQVSLLRYASELSPEAFGDYLQRGETGTFEIRRLPARDDPMLARVERIRLSEHLFTDTVDEQYEALYRDIAATYDLWRRYRRELAVYTQAEEERRKSRKPRASPGTYTAIKHSYDNYRWAKMEEQILERWAVGFNNEVAPTVMELEGRLVELEGSLEARYSEWRGILRSIFALESGEPGPPNN